MPDLHALLHQTADLAIGYLDGLDQRRVGSLDSPEALRAALGGPMPSQGLPASEVVAALAAQADPGIVASAGPRYFGFVTGGSLPAALAADWLTSTWDQNGFAWVMSPAGSVAEDVAGRWLLELFGLPPEASVGFTSGATMATFTGLVAGRHRVLARAGWDVERDGLNGAPPIAVVLGSEAHATVFAALQMAGLGHGRALRVASDAQGRMDPGQLRAIVAGLHDRPLLVSAQAGNVNTGAFDPLDEIAAIVRSHPNAWLHVDGAFGLWAAASPSRRGLTAGMAEADSWTTDAHKWLNVPYDCGVAMVRDRQAHRAAVSHGAAYYAAQGDEVRESGHWVPESSRRTRGFTVLAALRQLGVEGVAALVDRCCALARRMADGLRSAPEVSILNDVVLNQVLVRFAPPDDPRATPEAIDARTREVIAAVQAEGTCWAGGTTWQGMAAMRISVSCWATTAHDVDLSIDAIRRCAASSEHRAP